MSYRALCLLAALAFVSACDLDALLGGGDECSEDSDCSGSDICDSGECVECENDRDCDDDEECNDGDCENADPGEGEGEAGEGEGEAGEGEGEAGEGEGEGEACTIPEVGDCQGNVARFCDPDTNEIVEDDCSATSPATTCQEAFGVFLCAANRGGSCIVENEAGEAVISICAEEGDGCEVESLTDATCVAGGPTCGAGSAGTCIGDLAIIICIEQIGQATYLDCSAQGGICDTTAGGCLFQTGDTCVPDLSFCTDGATLCPANGVCP